MSEELTKLRRSAGAALIIAGTLAAYPAYSMYEDSQKLQLHRSFKDVIYSGPLSGSICTQPTLGGKPDCVGKYSVNVKDVEWTKETDKYQDNSQEKIKSIVLGGTAGLGIIIGGLAIALPERRREDEPAGTTGETISV